ncbi:MAG: hypothetical protein GX575_03845 [Candidatus Anammoximicrobium sp.]|nr:hypothetical protein [Candidatus Anammoximicrobium sp.]
MRHSLRILAVTVLACPFAGCGGAPQGSPEAADSASAPAFAGTPANGPAAAGASGPAAVVAQFYEALRTGNDTAIASLLTDKAREETSKSGLGIQSQASESLSYEIGETDFVSDRLDGAHVKTMWRETGPDGRLTSTAVIWVLRKQANGWKVSGMATPVVEGELPLLFNFEEPEDMLQKKEFVEQQLAPPAHAADAAPAAQAATAEASPPWNSPGTR